VLIADQTENGTGVVNADDRILGRVSLFYPDLTPGTVLTFSLMDGDRYIEADSDYHYQKEDLVLIGQTDISIVPIPGAFWIMGTGLLMLMKLSRCHRPYKTGFPSRKRIPLE
jgi:hypothetical protein